MQRLSIRRLMVVYRGMTAYDERFHDGVNIIHGSNGSGKSTIADLIFFVLGGELKEWKEHALRCESVICEILAGDAILTIKREISDAALQPMSIFFGEMDEALKHARDGWQLFDYKRTERGWSFSQVLFKAIGIPESVGDGGSNITMHQILRLMYCDQMTPVQRIFRAESFDSWATREAVGDLLCGLGGYDLFQKRLDLREAEDRYRDLTTKYRSLVSIAGKYGDDVRHEQIKAEVERAVKKRDLLYVELDKYIRNDTNSKYESTQSEARRKKTLDELTRTRHDIISLERKVETVEFDIEDSKKFIEYLDGILKEFEISSDVFEHMSSVQFECCPACLSHPPAHPKGHCHLCGNEGGEPELQARALALKLDLQLQLRESRSLQEDRTAALDRAKAELRKLTSQHRRLTEAYNALVRAPVSARDAKISEIGRQIGQLDGALDSLEKRSEIAKQIAKLASDREDAKGEVEKLKSEIEAIKSSQQRRKVASYTKISDWAKYMLSHDMPEHNDLLPVNSFSFDFGDDWIAVNDKKNISTSASGLVLVKNSFFYSLLAASVQDQDFNLPRFLLMDNIEDKGMVQERVWNFQRVLVEASKSLNFPHQVIFTTSKIAPDLDKSSFVVGGHYTKARRTLKGVHLRTYKMDTPERN